MKIFNSALEAVQVIKSNDTVFLHTAASTPIDLINAMTERSNEFTNVKLVSIHTEWEARYATEEHYRSFNISPYFVGSNVRKAVNEGKAQYTPAFLNEIPGLFRSGIQPVDVALISISVPDEKGYCTLGPNCDISLAAVEAAKYVIAEINPNMPRVGGDGVLHISRIHAGVHVNHPIYTVQPPASTETENKIGEYIATLIPDGATLQMGIGGIPDAVLSKLGNHKDLGIHTEMFADGVIDLVENGVITGNNKAIQKYKVVSGFAFGSQRLYDFIDNNLNIQLMDVGYVNNPLVICQNPLVHAINSAVEVDLSGQVCADSIGTRHYSGVGGQVDFMRGAAISPGGKPIIALPSITSRGESRIVSLLKPGASVTTSRAHVHYIVTEYGIAYLKNKNLKERAKALIEIAHPNFREQLEREAFEILKTR